LLDTDAGELLAQESLLMKRGHAEALMPMIARVMQSANLAFTSLDRIAVTVGPGSFTGLRVGIAFAKGLAAALDLPAVGIGALEALAAEADGLVFAVVDARRGQVYVQGFEDGRALMAPDALTAETAAARIAELSMGRPLTLVGSGAPLVQGLVPAAAVIRAEGADARHVARLAAGREPKPLKPLYLRAPDAKLPA
jgi:tRNA threonylcarbamoyladenosine biosynthesis protein TsaB